MYTYCTDNASVLYRYFKYFAIDVQIMYNIVYSKAQVF